MKRLLLSTALLAIVAASPAKAEDAAKAVEAAKQYSGSSITNTAEAGLQALLDTQ
ncbi:hypothetical protein BH10PSE7_BH10PSE7_12260 [soil metagenome]